MVCFKYINKIDNQLNKKYLKLKKKGKIINIDKWGSINALLTSRKNQEWSATIREGEEGFAKILQIFLKNCKNILEHKDKKGLEGV